MYYKNLSLEYLVEEIDGIVHVEQWKEIPGYEGLCEASSFGRIKSVSTKGQFRIKRKSTRREKILSQRLCKKTGYLSISLTDLQVNRKTFLVHRIIGSLFVPNPENKEEINHKKGIKTDNRATEIEWSTPSENQIHALKTGLSSIKYGEESGCTFLKNEIVLKIFNSPYSAKNLSAIFNIPIYVIYQIKNGKNWSRITGKTYKSKSSRRPESLVKEIFESDLPEGEILAKYNISSKYLWAIKKGKLWKKLLHL
jgi:hypothetical protein